MDKEFHDFSILTPSEKQLVIMLNSHATVTAMKMANILAVTVRTVEWHFANIRKKLDVTCQREILEYYPIRKGTTLGIYGGQLVEVKDIYINGKIEALTHYGHLATVIDPNDVEKIYL